MKQLFEISVDMQLPNNKERWYYYVVCIDVKYELKLMKQYYGMAMEVT